MEWQEKLNELGITLNRSGRQTCPRCSESRKNKTEKCLTVTFDKDAILYNCHHCDWHGAVYYRNKFESIKKYVRPNPPKVVDEKGKLYRYFEKRKISKETLDKYKVSINAQDEIIFQYYKEGNLTNIKYRKNIGNGKKTFRQEKDTEKTFFGMDEVKETNTLIIVEGEIDVLSLAEQGILSVSIPQGASETKLECIENCFDFIASFEEYIIAVDNDTAGDKLKKTLLTRLGKEKCKIVNWKQYKDANEALIAGENLKEFIDNAECIAPEGIINFYDSFDDIYKYNYEQDTDFYKTYWHYFDSLVKIRTGNLMVVTGYPSRGKSTFVDNLTVNLSKNYDMKHLIASFENTQARHYNTLLEMYCEKPIFKLKEENRIIGEEMNFIAEHFYRFDNSKMWSIDEICERTELAVKKYGVKTLTIDPYNRLKNDWKEREDKYIGSILAKLCMLAKKLDILIIFVAHPRKPDGEKMPNMYSISGSGDWYNMCDYGIIVHRERGDDGQLSNTPTIAVEKVKDFSLGEPSGGIFKLKYDVAKRTLHNLNEF